MTETISIGAFLWSDRTYVDGEWVDPTNRIQLAHPHYARAGWPTDLFEEPDAAPDFQSVLPRAAERVTDAHPAGPIDEHEPVDRGTFRKLGEIELTLDGEIAAVAVEPCPECGHHIDYREEPTYPERDAPYEHVADRSVYECEVDGEAVYHLGFGEHD